MEHVYLIIGETGEYSDRREWYVCAFRDKEAADTFAQACSDFVAEHWKGGYYGPHRHDCTHEGSPDPDVRMDYTGTTYTVEEVDLR